MATSDKQASEKIEFLKSELATVRFASKGHLGEASKAIEAVLCAFENVSVSELPKRVGITYRKQVETEIEQLKKANLRRIVRITSPELCSSQSNGNLGFTRWVDASREWRECEILAAVLEQYIDINTGECVTENFDEHALITIRQSRHIRASDQKKNKNNNTDVYTREHYNCPSCGAELEHIADQTNCPYCGAVIVFNFFDWQLDSFYLDMHKSSLIGEIKTTAASAAIGGVTLAMKIAEILAAAWDRADAQRRRVSGSNESYNNYLGAILTVLLIIGFIIAAILLALPWFVKVIIGFAAVCLICWGVLKYFRAIDQKLKKRKIVRYSDGYLRSCVYNEVWKGIDICNLIDFSIDDILIRSVKNTETTTDIDVIATVIKKIITEDKNISVIVENVKLSLTRARYPERVKSKGKMMEEKDCPSCGANFEPDEHNCCSYCGYGLKVKNYVWRANK